MVKVHSRCQTQFEELQTVTNRDRNDECLVSVFVAEELKIVYFLLWLIDKNLGSQKSVSH